MNNWLAIKVNLSHLRTIQISLLPKTSKDIKCLSRERYSGTAVEVKQMTGKIL